jgi:hypothetical protein
MAATFAANAYWITVRRRDTWPHGRATSRLRRVQRDARKRIFDATVALITLRIISLFVRSAAHERQARSLALLSLNISR